AVDQAANEIILLGQQGAMLTGLDRLRVPHSPVSIQVAADGRRCFIASLWSRQLSVVELRAWEKMGTGTGQSLQTSRFGSERLEPVPIFSQALTLGGGAEKKAGLRL